MKRRVIKIGAGLLAIAGVIALAVFVWYRGAGESDSNEYIRQWLRNPAARDALRTEREACGDAPFILPSDGFVGLLWGDPAAPYTPLQRHTGIDVFGDGAPGTVPVYAVYEGYLSRLDDWFSTVIIRHDDPLQPGRTIWTYYTHMGSRDGRTSYVVDDFPRGTDDVFVEQGTLLGYQGEYAGAGAPIAMHIHLSIVTSDETGDFNNEAILDNTLDPSPYFGLPLDIAAQPARPVRCGAA